MVCSIRAPSASELHLCYLLPVTSCRKGLTRSWYISNYLEKVLLMDSTKMMTAQPAWPADCALIWDCSYTFYDLLRLAVVVLGTEMLCNSKVLSMMYMP